MREEDERASLDKAEQKGEEKKEIEAVIGMHENGISIDLIAKSLKISKDKFLQIIENQLNKQNTHQ